MMASSFPCPSSNGQPSRTSSSSSCEQQHHHPWKLPWILTFIALYLFILPWIYYAIIQRYWIDRDWDSRLVNLGTTLPRRIFMLGHMTLGGLSLLLGPTQFIPIIRSRAPRFHRWCGRLYVAVAVGASIFGLVFIALKRGILVGGINMGLAFTAAGSTFGYCAYKVYQTASTGQFGAHRNWTIRSYSQCLSPMFYRYWYTFLVTQGWYDFEEETCHADTGVCGVYLRTFDMIHCWSYWLVPLATAELIVWTLPSHEKTYDPVSLSSHNNDEAITASSYQASVVEDGTNGNDHHCSSSTQIQTLQDGSTPSSSYLEFNVVGVSLSVVIVSTTIAIFSS